MLSDLFAQPWHLWLALGGILLAAEMLGASGFLLWSGIAAMLVSLLTWLVPLPWEWQGTGFALLTVLSALWWSHWLKMRADRQPRTLLNQRGGQLIGQQLILAEPLVNGSGRVKVGDGQWRVQAEENYPAGTTVTVIAIHGITLHISRTER